jgi:hypothetical protein
VRRFLGSTAIGLALTVIAPSMKAPDIFVYASVHSAEASIPDWITNSCCGPRDARRLRPDQVHHHDEGYYTVDGYFGGGGKIPDRIVKPSQDSDYWIFYGEYPASRNDTGNHAGGQSSVYCFFIPMAF